MKLVRTKDLLLNHKRLEIVFILIFLNVGLFIIRENSFDSYLLSVCIEASSYIIVGFFLYKLTSDRTITRKTKREKLSSLCICFGLIYIVVYYVLGIFDGYGRSPYRHDLLAYVVNYGLLVGYVFCREKSRSKILHTLVNKKNKAIICFTLSVLLSLLNFSFCRYSAISDVKELVQFVAGYFLPHLMLNYLLCILVMMMGTKTTIVYSIAVEGIELLLPILPNLKWITKSLLGIMFPMIILIYLEYVYHRYSVDNIRKAKNTEHPASLIATCLVAVGIIWFSVGVFPIYPSVIVSGSMKPNIDIGDVIIVKRVDIDSISVGDVIQFQKNQLDIAHRVIEIGDENGKFLRTKGDNNNICDNDPVMPDEIRGKVLFKVPKIGKIKFYISNSSESDLKELDLY